MDDKNRRALLKARVKAFRAAVKAMGKHCTCANHLNEQITRLSNEFKVSPGWIDNLFKEEVNEH